MAIRGPVVGIKCRPKRDRYLITADVSISGVGPIYSKAMCSVSHRPREMLDAKKVDKHIQAGNQTTNNTCT